MIRAVARWNLAAQVGLALIVAMGVCGAFFSIALILPTMEKIYADLNIHLPMELQTTASAADAVLQTWWVWVSVIVGGWGLFEWKYQRPNKSLVRLNVSVGAALLVTAMATYVAGAIMFSAVSTLATHAL